MVKRPEVASSDRPERSVVKLWLDRECRDPDLTHGVIGVADG